MVMAEALPEVSAQALPRVALQADAELLPRRSAACAEAKAQYLARFPDAAVTFELPDFSLFLLHPVSARLVAGFGRASALVAPGLVEWLRGSGQ
jgi:putative heme iron utilization protein